MEVAPCPSNACSSRCLVPWFQLTSYEYSVQANNDLVWNRQHQRSLWTQGMSLPDKVTRLPIKVKVL